MVKKSAWIFTCLIASGVFLIDQISKFLVLNWGWSYAQNPGVAFGLLSSIGGIIPVLVLLVFVLWIYKSVRAKRKLHILDWVILGFVIGGGASNEIDRVLKGGVVDIFYLGIGPHFNFADASIVVGVLLAAWDTIIFLEQRRL